MAEINRRYFEGLMADQNLSLRALAKKMEMGHSQLSLAFSGVRKLQADEIAKISSIFGEPVHRVLENAGISVRPTSGRRAPVIGRGNGDGTVELYGADVLERVGAPDELPDNVQAVQHRTTGTPLDWLDGAVSFFRPPRDIDLTSLGRLSLCKIKGGPAVVTGIRRGYKEGTFNCFGPYNAESVTLEYATPILVTRH